MIICLSLFKLTTKNCSNIEKKDTFTMEFKVFIKFANIGFPRLEQHHSYMRVFQIIEVVRVTSLIK